MQKNEDDQEFEIDDGQQIQNDADIKTDNKALKIIEKQKKEKKDRQKKAEKVRNEGLEGPKDPE